MRDASFQLDLFAPGGAPPCIPASAPASAVVSTDGIVRDATLSPCGTYRYVLSRVWDDTRSRVLWVMLNPSTADASQDDPTMRRCISFARSWGYGSLAVVNLFALRSPNPKNLPRASDPIGPENDEYIARAAADAGRIVVAWGANVYARSRAQSVVRILMEERAVKRPLLCLGTTNDGYPKHPLYVPASAELVPYLGRKEAAGA